MDPKQSAALAALDYVQSGMTVGLGTGSTARFFIDLLGDAIADGRLTHIRGVATSVKSAEQGMTRGIGIVGFETVGECDLTVDGADEIAPNLDLIKGLGGALLREKVVAQNSRRLIIIADETKRVASLGSRAPLPVEVTQFAHEATERAIVALGGNPRLRQADNGRPFVTDNGNYIYDCRFKTIANAAELNAALKARAGVVETGLFLGMADVVLIGRAEGVEVLRREDLMGTKH